MEAAGQHRAGVLCEASQREQEKATCSDKTFWWLGCPSVCILLPGLSSFSPFSVPSILYLT